MSADPEPIQVSVNPDRTKMHISEYAELEKTEPAKPKEFRTLVTLKSGHQFVCGLSASTLKHIKRTGGMVRLVAKGKKVNLDSRQIRSISSQPSE
jgi:hypothetical protein